MYRSAVWLFAFQDAMQMNNLSVGLVRQNKVFTFAIKKTRRYVRPERLIKDNLDIHEYTSKQSIAHKLYVRPKCTGVFYGWCRILRKVVTLDASQINCLVFFFEFPYLHAKIVATTKRGMQVILQSSFNIKWTQTNQTIKNFIQSSHLMFYNTALEKERTEVQIDLYNNYAKKLSESKNCRQIKPSNCAFYVRQYRFLEKKAIGVSVLPSAAEDFTLFMQSRRVEVFLNQFLQNKVFEIELEKTCFCCACRKVQKKRNSCYNIIEEKL